MSSDQRPNQITGYSYNPFIDLTPDEIAKLSPMTRNAKTLIYLTGFLANTRQNRNGWRISDNKYLAANKGLEAGKPIIFGPKQQGLAHHPNFYRDLDITGDPQKDRKTFLAYQESSRIGDMFRMQYNAAQDRWDFNGAISHPNIVEAIQKGELQLPKYVSPYFWNLNDPKDTGTEIRDAELFHHAFVDDPAYGPEVATIYHYCDPSKEGTACMAKIMGMGAGKEQMEQARKGMWPCACGLMASYENKVDSSFYVERPQKDRNDLSDSNPTTSTQPQGDKPIPDANVPTTQDDKQREALNKMQQQQQYDNDANAGKTNIETNKEKNNNPSIPVEFQDLVNIQIEKERKNLNKQFEKQTAEKDELITKLQAEIAKRNESDRDAILNKYIEKDNYKEEATYKKRLDFYKNLAKETNLSNERLEELLQDHYEVKELKISIDHQQQKNNGTQNKGKGAGLESLNKDPFGFGEGVDADLGLLQSARSYKKGLAASSSLSGEDSNNDPTDADEDNPEDTYKDNKGGAAIVSAFG